jgi:serine/threonine protein phosphatase 1
MSKRWVIPDIHGYLDTLKALIEERIKPARTDELYFLGDYIDRGPDSRGVINYIRSLRQDGYAVTALKGNHEDFLEIGRAHV